MANPTIASVTLNDLPQELLEVVIDLLPQNPVFLRALALVGKRWVRRCQERLFERLTLSSQQTERWTRPLSEHQPSFFSYVRALTLRGVYPPDWRNPSFRRYMSCFADRGGSNSSGRDREQEPCRVHTLRLLDCSVDLDGEVISQVLGPLRSSVRTVIMGSVSIPSVMEVRPFFCLFSELRNVHIPGPQFSSAVPHGDSRFAKQYILPPLNGELKLLFLYHGVEGVLSSLSKLPLRFRSITVSPPNGKCDLEINKILIVCGETVKTFDVKRMKLGASLPSAHNFPHQDPDQPNLSDVQVLRPITLSPCTNLEEIRIGLRDSRDPGPGTIHLFDSVTSPHLSRIVLHFVVPLNSRKMDSNMYLDDWTGVDQSLYRLAERLRAMRESRLLDSKPNWTEPRKKEEVKRLKVFIEARFLFVRLTAQKVDLGSFLSKFREVGDVVFIPQKIRTPNDEESDGLLTSPTF